MSHTAGEYYAAFQTLCLERTEEYEDAIEKGFSADQKEGLREALGGRLRRNDVDEIFSILMTEYERKIGRR